MKIRLLFIISIITLQAIALNSQTLVNTYPFPVTTAFNGFWGIADINDTLRIGSSSTGKIYRVTKTGNIIDSLTTPFSYNNGLAWDGTGFWIARNASSSNPRMVKVNSSGTPVDSIRLTNLFGNVTIGIGGIAMDGNFLWAAIYYPDFTSYPYSYAVKFDLVTKNIVDTIPLRGKQVQGIAVKGDTIFYVTDNFQGDQERIYAYRKAVGDTLFSFPAPDPDNDCDPRGLYWDGQHLYLMAYRVGSNIGQFRTLYKYTIGGGGSPLITTSTSSINFGNVIIGQTGNQNLTINNVGTGSLIINSFTMTNPRFSINPNTVPDTITAGLSKNYTLGFTPNSFDVVTGELRIASNDLANPLKVIALTGKGVYSGAFFGASVQGFNYSDRRINSLSGFTFDITNQGSQPLTINSCSFSSARYRFDTAGANFPITIDTQRTRTFRIWFNPNAAATFGDTAVFSTNAVNNSTAKIGLTGNGVDLPPVLGDIMWEGNIPDNPCTSSDDFQPKSMKQINDVNGDGVADMIVATENYWTICFNGNSSVTADTLWLFNSCFGSINTGSVDWEDAMQIIEDINGDGIQDVIIGCGGGNEMVYALSGSNGAKIWEFGSPTTTSDGDIYGLRADKDYNNDGTDDVLISASGEANFSGRHAVICVNGLNGQVIFNSVFTTDNFTYDCENLPAGGVIGAGSNGGPYAIKGFNNSGLTQWSFPVTSAVWSLRRVPDINEDSYPDIVSLWGFNGDIVALSGNSGAQIWSTNLSSANNGTVEILDDKNHNGFKDLSFSGIQTAARVDSKTGAVLWTRGLFSSFIRDVGFLGDVTGDSIGEILYATQQPGKVFVLNGDDGVILFEYTFGTSISQRCDRTAALNSIDGNDANEFTAASRDGRIKCFSGGPGQVIGIISNNNSIPEKFKLFQNYPNPFNPVTNIKFNIPLFKGVSEGGGVLTQLIIYDVTGREVSVLVNDLLKPGEYSTDWNASNFASGVYFYKITAGDFSDVKKMILLK